MREALVFKLWLCFCCFLFGLFEFAGQDGWSRRSHVLGTASSTFLEENG